MNIQSGKGTKKTDLNSYYFLTEPEITVMYSDCCIYQKNIFYLDWNNRCESFFGSTVVKERWLHGYGIMDRLLDFKDNRSK
jgi:hypothetical protein